MFTSKTFQSSPRKGFLFAEHLFAYVILLILLSLHFLMVLKFEVNWDEFFRLGRIYEWKAESLTAIFESNYIHVFTWLEHVHKNEVYQVIAARGVMYVLLLYIARISFLILNHFFNRTTAAITLISFLSFSFVFRHATSFRIDPPIISLLMTVIWLIAPAGRKRRHFVVAGLCLGLAGSISIKSIFYVPTIAAILLIHWWQSGWKVSSFFNGLLVGLTSLIGFATLIYLHSLSLSTADSALGFISYASNAAILEYGFFPQKGTIFISIDQNPIYWCLLLIGLCFAIYHIFRGQNRIRALICLSGILPMLSLAIYVHTYIYFYTYLLAAGSLIVAYGVYEITKRYPIAAHLIPLALMANAVPVFILSLKQTKSYQVQVNDVIHTMFPNPVNYIDRTSQISSFPKQGLFMTVVQMNEYKMRGMPVMKEVFESSAPEFVLANIASLKLDTVRDTQPSRRLMREDEDILVDNFIHHWGPIYVPGKSIHLGPEAQQIRIEIAGTYTIESKEEISIKGVTYQPHSSLHLNKEILSIASQTPQNIQLRWGQNLYKPEFEPLGKTVFRGF